MANSKKNFLPPRLISDDTDLEEIKACSADNIRFEVVTGLDRWLEAAYNLLADEFDESVLDPYERYVEWLELNRSGKHRFPFLMVVAYLRVRENSYIAGVISGNVMRIDEYAGKNPQSEKPPYILAIGHQVTSKPLRSMGFKGVGTRLWNAAILKARNWIEERGGSFSLSLLEAEADSMGFWYKLGYLWPRGVRYWQPPLEFDEEGNYIHPEVPENLLLKPIEAEIPETIPATFLKNIVATVYYNWSLDKYKATLSDDAFQKAQKYVMGDLFDRFCQKMPSKDPLELVRIEISKDHKPAKHVRTMALSQGVQHGFEPLQALELDKINDFDEMLEAMKKMAFGARTLGNALDVLYSMVSDTECRVVLTLSGAVTIAKLDGIIAEMIERGLVQCIVTTGAAVCHGFNAERGCHHFKNDRSFPDAWLYEQGYDRIYDTLEQEYALDELEDILDSLLSKQPDDKVLCSSDIVNLLGDYLSEKGVYKGIIQAAHSRNIPTFIPAFTDSELGLDFAIFNYNRRQEGLSELRFDPFIDFERYCEFIRGSDTLGIITLGGGVPRNWAQQVGPYIDAIERRKHGIFLNPVRFKYALRICPDPDYWGGLSGSTYSEGISWGKISPGDEGGLHAEILSDFTFVFPFLIKALFQKLDKNHE
ncbi:MAG: deoxyhypusine synthase family protein [Blastocatellia bacterium]|nr:deoxyhypusine synthase family protein [Blastocatellia bacterium]